MGIKGKLAIMSMLTLRVIARTFFGWRIRRLGFESPAELALKHLRRACRPDGIVWAGLGHFRCMWPTDTGKAWEGILLAMGEDYGERVLRVILEASGRCGHVPSVIASPKSFADLPFRRVDNLPWLVYMLKRFPRKERLLSEYGDLLHQLVQNWLKWAFDEEKNMIRPDRPFDWADSVLRPSSAYANHVALRMFLDLEDLGFVEGVAEKMEGSVLKRLWMGEKFLDYLGADPYLSADANIYPVYLGLYDEEIRRSCAQAMLKSELLKVPVKLREGKYPIRMLRGLGALPSISYHSVCWPHLGALFSLGLLRMGMLEEAKEVKSKLENIVRKFGSFVETLYPSGKPYWHAESSLTMFAAPFYALSKKLSGS